MVILYHHVGGFAQTGVNVNSQRGVHHIADGEFFIHIVFDEFKQVISADHAENFSFDIYDENRTPSGGGHGARGGDDGRFSATN